MEASWQPARSEGLEQREVLLRGRDASPGSRRSAPTCHARSVDDAAGAAEGRPTEGEAAEAVMPNRPDSTPAARAFLTRLLNGWGVEQDVIDDAGLLTTELMSNAVRHGSGLITLRIEVDAGAIQVRVHDDGADTVQVKEVGEASVGGRGLFIVECVADQWGSDPDDPGKSVWFRLRSSSAADS